VLCASEAPGDRVLRGLKSAISQWRAAVPGASVANRPSASRERLWTFSGCFCATSV
jgi:hypothetical protein